MNQSNNPESYDYKRSARETTLTNVGKKAHDL